MAWTLPPGVTNGSTYDPTAVQQLPSYMQALLGNIPAPPPDSNHGNHSDDGGTNSQQWQQASAQSSIPALTAAMQKGDYSSAWQLASQYPEAVKYLVKGSNVQQMVGNMTPTQMSAFYKAAEPYAQTLAASGGNTGLGAGYNWNASGNAIQSGNDIYNKLAALSANPSSGGSMPNIAGIAGNANETPTAALLSRAAIVAGAAALTGGAAGAAGLGGIGAGALSGAASSAIGSSVNDAPITLGSVGKGALTGAVAGGITSAVGPGATSALTNAGMNPTIAGEVVRGGIGAGTSALGSALRGGNVGQAALLGGVNGLVSGAINNGAGNNSFGDVGGTIASTLLGRYMNQPGQPSSIPHPAPTPAQPVAATSAPQATPPATPPSMSTGQQGMPTGPTAAPPGPTTNIGSYFGGLGYQPMSKVDPGITNYNNYGQGPEASFFKPTPGT